MELNSTLIKIKELMKVRNWTIYRLAKESDIPYSSLNSLFQKNNQPTISTLEKYAKDCISAWQNFFQMILPTVKRAILSQKMN